MRRINLLRASALMLATLLAMASAAAESRQRAEAFGDSVHPLGLLHLPSGAARPAAVVLLVHDSLGLEARSDVYVAQLRAAGIAVLEMELRANPPDGHPEPLPDLHDAAAMVARAMTALARDGRFDPSRLGAIGFGTGARAVALASAVGPAAIAAQVLLYPGCRSLAVQLAAMPRQIRTGGVGTLLLHGEADIANASQDCEVLAAQLAMQGPTRRIGFAGALYAWDQPQVGGSPATSQPAPDGGTAVPAAFWPELADLSATMAAAFLAAATSPAGGPPAIHEAGPARARH